MGSLRVMSAEGDRTLAWDQKGVESGDPEAMAAVKEAERILVEELNRGGTAFRVEPNSPARRIDHFDPEADQIITVPRVMGG